MYSAFILVQAFELGAMGTNVAGSFTKGSVYIFESNFVSPSNAFGFATWVKIVPISFTLHQI